MKDFDERKKHKLEGIDESHNASIVKKMIDEFNLDKISCTKEEEKEMVKNSEIMILPGLTFKKLFLFDQVRKQEDFKFVSGFESLDKVEGTWYDPKIETLNT